MNTPVTFDVPTPIHDAVVAARTRHRAWFGHSSAGPPATRLDAARDVTVLASVVADGPFESVCVGGDADTYWVEVTDEATAPTYRCVPGGASVAVEAISNVDPSDGADHWSLAAVERGNCPDDLAVWYAVLDTRNWGDDFVESDGDAALAASCFDLAGSLLGRLTPAWVDVDGRTDCYVMRGGVRSDEFDPDGPVTRRTIEAAGQVHFWVEATTARGERYVCDPWGRVSESYGHPMVTLTRPENYVPAIDGRVPLSVVDGDSHWADPVV